MDHLMAKDAILDKIYTFAYALDSLSQSQITSLFRPDHLFTFDISGVLGPAHAAKDITPEQLYQASCAELGGFDATHHQLGCPLVTFPAEAGDKAHVKLYVTAYHVMEIDGAQEAVTARVSWNFDVEKFDGKWVIRKFVIERAAPLDHVELMKAHERYEGGSRRAAM